MARKYKKKSPRKVLENKLDEVVKQIIRIRDGVCQHCGKTCIKSDAHTCHVVPKGKGASWRRFDLLNVFLGCSYCHTEWWHKNILDANDWFKEKFPARYDYLSKYRGGKAAKITDTQMELLYGLYVVKLTELRGEK